MNQTISTFGAREWSEAGRRAETYLRSLQGGTNAAEPTLLAQALATARTRSATDETTHPVTLVMESLFDLLPPAKAPAPTMTPPIDRVRMLPEKTEFPLHDGLRRIFRSEIFLFAGA